VILESQGANLYGFDSNTKSLTSSIVRTYERYLRLSPGECAALERWRAPVVSSALFVSADRQERYQVDLDGQGRTIALRHDVRPEERPPEVPADSAAAIARRLLGKELGLDVARLEMLPATELPSSGRRDREFKWRLPDPLPGGAVATATVRTAGSSVVLAMLEAELPKTVTRRYEDAENYSVWIGALAFLILLVVAAIELALWRRHFDRPSLRFTIVALTSALVLILLLTYPFRHTAILPIPMGMGLLATAYPTARLMHPLLLLSLIVAAVPLLGGGLLLLLGAILGTLRAEDPRLVAGLADFLRLRTPRAAWARSATVGIPLGVLAAAVLRFLPWVAHRVGAGLLMPDYLWPGHSSPVIGWLAQTGLGATWSLVPCGMVLVLIVSLRRWLRLGAWAWWIVLISGTLLFNDNPLVIQPGYLGFLRGMVTAGIIFWTCARFGLLTATISWVVAGSLDTAVPYIGAQATSLRVSGLVVVGLCLVALALALNALRAPRDAAPRPSPSTAA
jgi:hypothetical protein